MTDVAYLCHNCGSVHELESIRENLILDLRAAASYELSGQRGVLGPRARFLRWRMTRDLVQALWPAYSDHPPLGWSRRLVQGPPVPVAATGSGSRPAVPAVPPVPAIPLQLVRTLPGTREGTSPSARPPSIVTRPADAYTARALRSKGASRLARLLLTLLAVRRQ